MAQQDPILRQAGVLAYRIRRDEIEILLLTSRETGRWLIPKGNIPVKMTPAQAAASEAFEEAGIRGEIDGSLPMGVYTYFKRLPSGQTRLASVEVYLLHVRKQLKKWPEKHERQITWVSAAEAINLVEEPSVVPLLLRLQELQETLCHPAPVPPIDHSLAFRGDPAHERQRSSAVKRSHR
jgi:8-oxo-dGTP pyrophosphatase MutT (NUDIX family)